MDRNNIKFYPLEVVEQIKRIREERVTSLFIENRSSAYIFHYRNGMIQTFDALLNPLTIPLMYHNFEEYLANLMNIKPL